MPVIKVNTDIVMVDRGHKEDKENIHSDKEEDMDEEQLKDDSDNVMDTNNEDYIDDEPVSPPPCSPEEAPKLLMSQTIEELVVEVVDTETRSKDSSSGRVTSVSPLLAGDTIPRTITSSPSPSSSLVIPVPLGGSMIPLTVSEIVDPDPGSRAASAPAALHMSGGGVYTTDCFLNQSQQQPRSSSRTESVIRRNPSPGLSNISRIPSPGLLNISRNNPSPGLALANNKAKEDLEHHLTKTITTRDGASYRRIPAPTIKLSDSLEITPITMKPLNLSMVTQKGGSGGSVTVTKQTKRHFDKDEGDGRKRNKLQHVNELLIEKVIPQKDPSSKKCLEQSTDMEVDDENNKVADCYNCKLVIPTDLSEKKVKLVFQNGQTISLNRTLFKKLNVSGKKTRKIQRKSSTTKKSPTNDVTSVNNQTLSKVDPANNDKATPPSPQPTAEVADDKENEQSVTTSVSNSANGSKIPSPVLGTHKLPSVISQPSYYNKLRGRKPAVKV